MIRERAISPVEAVDFFLGRIERINPRINAFVTVTAERARREAKAAERRLMSEDPHRLGPLHGVPIAIKELANTAGVKSTSASRAFAHRVPDQSDVWVDRLFAAGAIMLGKTNSPEFGLNATSEDGLYPPTRNPWNPDRSAGGSSGGTRRGAGGAPLPLRRGQRRGRLDPHPGGGLRRRWAETGALPGADRSLRRGAGRRLGLVRADGADRRRRRARARRDGRAGRRRSLPHRTAGESFLSAVDEAPPRLRIAWTPRSPAGPIDPEVAAAVERTRDVLAGLGHELVEGFPDTSGLWEEWPAMASAFTAATDIPDPDLLGPHARAAYDAGMRMSARDLFRLKDRVYEKTRDILAWCEAFDVILCPTLTRPAPPLGELNKVGQEVWDLLFEYIPFTYWVNMTGQPAFSLPLAWSSDGMPIGVQLVGRQLGERTIISLAARLEEAMPWRDRRPPVV